VLHGKGIHDIDLVKSAVIAKFFFRLHTRARTQTHLDKSCLSEWTITASVLQYHYIPSFQDRKLNRCSIIDKSKVVWQEAKSLSPVYSMQLLVSI